MPNIRSLDTLGGCAGHISAARPEAARKPVHCSVLRRSDATLTGSATICHKSLRRRASSALVLITGHANAEPEDCSIKGTCNGPSLFGVILIVVVLLVAGWRGLALFAAISLFPVALALLGALLGAFVFGKDSLGPTVLGLLGFLLSFKVVGHLRSSHKSAGDSSVSPADPESALPRSATSGVDASVREVAAGNTRQPDGGTSLGPPNQLDAEETGGGTHVGVVRSKRAGNRAARATKAAPGASVNDESIRELSLKSKEEVEGEVIPTLTPKPMETSQLLDQESTAALEKIITAAPRSAGCAVLAGQSQIRFVIVYGANLRGALQQFATWVQGTARADHDWCRFSSHGFYGLTCVGMFETKSADLAKALAHEQVARREAAKPGCTWLWR